MNLPTQILDQLAAFGVSLRLAQGDVATAACLLEERGIGADDAVDHLNELEHLVLARVLLARDEPEEALELLDRLLEAAEESGRMGSVIGILAIRALAHGALAKEASTLADLGRASRSPSRKATSVRSWIWTCRWKACCDAP
jgi:LuxR family maltose regulon positive regulatory protein